MSQWMSVAADGAARGATVALEGFGRRHVQHVKADGSIFTAEDVNSESAVRKVLSDRDPGTPIVGEELSAGTIPFGTFWIVDPIDGTENYCAGNPVWATMVARVKEGSVVAAAVCAPALAQSWRAGRGQGAFKGGGRIAVSRLSEVRDARLCFGGIHEYRPGAELDRMVRVASTFRTAWGWGNFWGHMLVAEGVCDVAVSRGTRLWDTAAPSLIVEEAGGTWSDVDGVRHLDNGTIVSSNGILHPQVVGRL